MKTTPKSLVGALILAAARTAFTQGTCNPLTAGVGKCAPNPGLPSSTYSIDFSKQTTTPKDWIVSNYATVDFGLNGAEFTIAKRFDAPQLWTDFYLLYGKVETVMQVAPGQGVISSSVLISDDLDEIDWEFSGNDFGMSSGKGQNNFYGKGVTGAYDRGQFFDVSNPQAAFHTYTVDWTAERIIWSVDGNVVRTLYASDCDNDSHQYPQSPSRLQLGIWDGGDADSGYGTVSWAGGYTDLTKAPFTMYVKSVSITNYNPAYAFNYTDASGSGKSIQIIQKPVSTSTSTSATSTVPLASLASTAISSVISAVSSSLASLGTHFAGSSATPSVTASTASLSITSTPAVLTSATTTRNYSTSAETSSETFSKFSFFPNTSSSVVLTSQVPTTTATTNRVSTSSTSTEAATTSTTALLLTTSTTSDVSVASTTAEVVTTPTSTQVSSASTSTSSPSTSATPSVTATTDVATTTTDHTTSVSSTTPIPDDAPSTILSAIPVSVVPMSSKSMSSEMDTTTSSYSSQPSDTTSQASDTASLESNASTTFPPDTTSSVAEETSASTFLLPSLTTDPTQKPATTSKATLGTPIPSQSALATATSSTTSSASRNLPFSFALLRKWVHTTGHALLGW